MIKYSWQTWVFVALIALAIVAGAIYWQTWQMPAPLSLAHASIENDCAKCHAPWSGSQSELCLACHKTTAAEIKSGKGEHAQGHTQCDQCHVEHRGRDVYIVPTARGIAIQDSCVNCHSNEKLLQAVRVANSPTVTKTVSINLMVDVNDWFKSSHGQLNCVDCHRGDSHAVTQAGAHKGLIKDPSVDPVVGCGQTGCHANRAEKFKTALHFTSQGLAEALPLRSDAAHLPQLHEAITTQCTYCHATCGTCHVSHPAWNSPAGLIDQHRFVNTSAMDKGNCNDCHSPADDYMGNGDPPYPADVHWSAAKLDCMACHTDVALHGDGQPMTTKPAIADHVRTCESCHPETVSGKSDNQYHDLHAKQVACEVCHAQEYDNCYGCHVTRNATTGLLKRKAQNDDKEFRIGRLPTSTATQPRYGLVAHVPVARDTYLILGNNLLPRFDDVPTWKPTTPHNIQLKTKQNATCEACHNNPDLWLKPSDLDPNDAKANQTIAVQLPKISTTATFADNDKPLDLVVGAFVQISLTNTITADWSLVSGNFTGLKPSSDPMSKNVFKFQAVAAGSTVLQFADKSTSGQGNTYRLTINIRPR